MSRRNKNPRNKSMGGRLNPDQRDVDDSVEVLGANLDLPDTFHEKQFETLGMSKSPSESPGPQMQQMSGSFHSWRVCQRTWLHGRREGTVLLLRREVQVCKYL
eukprot:CAMPEP_0176004990 /NCGR_PEP_ID=MMETSP0120_2-20121206/1977_1 /TAXON_ID=160619 /ORGANISM="Kryptoperidinium foliaceum, Strain CCMP 1326" /LENGTH=102 /DNA_ID=CAMNT_0017337687 /DNA_START=52 /DNA_END=360 /DNA_ORIENTATION=-